jgi:hypothetical protein
LAQNKQDGTAGGQKKATATREQLLSDIRRIYKLFPNVVITRDFYRVHGKFLERTWSQYWPKFSDMVKEAGCEPAKPTPVVEIVKEIPVADKLEFELRKMDAKKDDSKKLLAEAAKKIKTLEEQNEAFLGLQGKQVQTYEIQPKVPSGHSEAVAFMIASDWHNEERVRLQDVSNQNEFNLEIFKQRSDAFFRGGQRLWGILRKDTQIKTLVLALLGDFITGSIHEDAAESNYLPPSEAIWNAEEKIASGIKFLLENTDVEELAIPCHSGNHGRMTKKQRHSTEQGNSLEQYMYKHLETHFSDEPRVKFMISGGYLSYMKLFDKYTIRFHHGHAINYGGGVGGITIPVIKAIDKWNTMDQYRNVNLDVFGHFHQYVNYGNFVCNGSLIGYNAYAQAIKAAYERPQQAFFLVSKKYMSKTMSTPIFVESSK